MGKTRTEFVNQMKKWIGRKEADGTHKAIIDIYNSHKPLARGYSVKYTDAWCATTVSACAIATGMTSIVPLECSCPRMVSLAQSMGIWVENDAYVPKMGDIILYDWQDTGSGDNKGVPDHIGVVESCNGVTMTIIEGNLSDSVKRRTLGVNGRYIRGFICPRFEEESVQQTQTTSTVTTTTTGGINRSEKWKGTVTASSLNVRTWAGVQNKTCSFSPLKNGTVVSVCDSVKASDGSTWYFIRYNGKYGFVHSAYITK